MGPCLSLLFAAIPVRARAADDNPQLAQLSSPAPGAPRVPVSPAVPQEIQPSPPSASSATGIPPAPISPRVSLPSDQVPFEVGKGPKLGPYYLIRSEEDFSYLRDPSKSNDIFDPLKFVRLNADGSAYVTFSGEERFQYEYYTDDAFTRPRPKHQNDLYFRHLYGADVHLGDHFRAFVSLNSGQQGGSNYGQTSPNNRDDLAVQQAFGEVMGTIGGVQTGLRVGRQEIWFGSGLLISTRENANLHQVFDGVRGYFDTGKLRVDVFGFDSVTHRFGVLNDSSNPHQNIWGFYGTQVLPVSHLFGARARLFIDPFYLGYGNRGGTFEGFRGHDERQSFGGRLWGQIGNADLDVTGLYQAGGLGGADVSAFAVFSDAGYTFQAPWRPRIGVRFDVASGGRSGNTLNAYNPLYALFNYTTESGLIAPINLYDAAIGVSFSPTQRLRVLAYTSWYWRYAENDGIYNKGYVPYAGTVNAKGSAVGVQPALRVAYLLNRHVTLSGSLALFKVDSVFRNAGAKNNEYAAARIRFTF